MAICVLKKGAELLLKEGYPWVYAWDLKEESAEAGEVVDLLDHRLKFYCPRTLQSQFSDKG